MELLRYLLPVILIYPIIINRLPVVFLRSRSIVLTFACSLMVLFISVISFLDKKPIELLILETSWLNISLKFDVLSGLMIASVVTIGIVILRYSLRYLEDDPKKEAFCNNLSYTLTFVIAMLMASNLAVLFLAWIATSYFLHRLLIHFSERTLALRAARQKFFVSRCGDAFIIAAGVSLLFIFRSLEFETIFKMLADPLFLKQNEKWLQFASLLLVVGAMTKSAQFPFHFWLPNTMETPTPVSALMHAGIINAGGYLVLRMSPLLEKAPISLSLLAIVGGFTAVFGFVIMLSQTNIKKSLAYSTISQMGFMMLQCGLGAFSVAVLHIVGHSFYKAYAFLSSSTATDFGRLNRYFPKPISSKRGARPVLTALGTASMVFAMSYWLRFDVLSQPGISVLMVVLSLATAQIILSSDNISKSTLAASGIALMYLGLSKSMSLLLEHILPLRVSDEGFLQNVAPFICATFFVALYVLQNSLPEFSKTKFGKKLYVMTLKGVP